MAIIELKTYLVRCDGCDKRIYTSPDIDKLLAGEAVRIAPDGWEQETKNLGKYCTLTGRLLCPSCVNDKGRETQ